MSNAKNRTSAMVGAAVAVVAFAGIATFAIQSQQAKKTDPQTSVQKPIEDIDIQLKPTADDSVKVLNPVFKGDELTFTESTEKVPAGTNPMSFAIESYLKNIPAVPKTVKVLNCSVENKIATVDFSSDIMAGYGTEDEQMIINGILKTFGKFPEVNAVRILIDGEPAETLGNIEIQNPQPVIH